MADKRIGVFLLVGMIVERYVSMYGETPKRIIELFDQNGILDYLIQNYDVLHTLGLEYLVEDVRQLLHSKGVILDKIHVDCSTGTYTGIMFGSVAYEISRRTNGEIKESLKKFLMSQTGEQLSRTGGKLETMSPAYIADCYEEATRPDHSEQ